MLKTGEEIDRLKRQPGCTRLLAAAHGKYSAARRRHRLRIGLGAGLAALAPIAVLYVHALQVPLGIVGGLGVVAVFWLEQWDRTLSSEGAAMMEEYDTTLFGLRWNDLLVGNRPTPEALNGAEKSFSGRRDELADWYPNVEGLPAAAAQLVLQRCTAVWDERQRRSYASFVALVTGVVFSAGLLLAVNRQMSLTDYLLLIALPSILAYMQGIGAVLEQLQTARRRELLWHGIESLLDQHLAGGRQIAPEDVRDAQNILYITRTRPGGVPRFVFDRLKSRLATDQQAAADHWRGRFSNRP